MFEIKQDGFYQLSEIAEVTGVNIQSIRKMLKAGLKAAKFGKNYVVKGADLIAFIERAPVVWQAKPKAEIKPKPQGTPQAAATVRTPEKDTALIVDIKTPDNDPKLFEAVKAGKAQPVSMAPDGKYSITQVSVIKGIAYNTVKARLEKVDFEMDGRTKVYKGADILKAVDK